MFSSNDIDICFWSVKSYEGTESTGHCDIQGCDVSKLEGKHVLFVEDIIDTGLTMKRYYCVICIDKLLTFQLMINLSLLHIACSNTWTIRSNQLPYVLHRWLRNERTKLLDSKQIMLVSLFLTCLWWDTASISTRFIVTWSTWQLSTRLDISDLETMSIKKAHWWICTLEYLVETVIYFPSFILPVIVRSAPV